MLSLENISATIEKKEILKNLSLEISHGEIHAIMGPNGAGKSTLANLIMGKPDIQITSGVLNFEKTEITKLPPEKRAQKGIFLSFQNPREIPGAMYKDMLSSSHKAITNASSQEKEKKKTSFFAFKKMINDAATQTHLPITHLNRPVNQGFSGGEKKKAEILQMLLLKPKLIILDEIDSGLDIDAIKIITQILIDYKKNNPKTSFLIISHHNKILQKLTPKKVHIMINGKITQSGNATLIEKIENKGYKSHQL